MKKVLSIVLALALVFACAFAQAEEATDKDFVVTLTGNPTTGYEWKYVTDEEMVSVTEEFLTGADIDKLAGVEPAEPMPGEGGLYVYTIKGLKPGDTVIAFEYARGWEQGSAEAGLTYTLHVGDDLSVVAVASTLGI